MTSAAPQQLCSLCGRPEHGTAACNTVTEARAVLGSAMHEFYVLGVPVPKARARVTKDGHAYTPEKTAQAEQDIAWEAKISNAPLIPEGPITLEVAFIFPWPKSLAKKRRREPHTGRPDLSNLLKTVEDALNGICWTDDAQISWVRAYKEYGAPPRTTVRYGAME